MTHSTHPHGNSTDPLRWVAVVALCALTIACSDDGDGNEPIDPKNVVEPQELVVDEIFGDANLDGVFDSKDLVAIFQSGKFESGESATWGEGDWNGDGRFDTSDLTAAFQDGRYLNG